MKVFLEANAVRVTCLGAFLSLLGCASSDVGEDTAAVEEKPTGGEAGSGNMPAPMGGAGEGNEPEPGEPMTPVPEEPTDSPEPAAPVDTNGPAVGNFTVNLVPPNEGTGTPGITSMQGAVRTGPLNEPVVWEERDAVGDCILRVPTVPVCDPACGTAAGCVADDVCKDHPTPLDVGAVTVTGLETEDGVTEFTINPTGPNHNYLVPASVKLLYPPTTEGGAVSISAEGGEVDAFTIESFGVSAVEVPNMDPIPIDRDLPLDLDWMAGGSDASEMAILVDISHHGGAKGKIQCIVADSGSASIDASLVTQLIDLGVAGFPTVKLTRRAVGSAGTSYGRVDLTVLSDIELPLSVPGVVSCGGDEDCEDGQTCRTDRTCG